VVQTSKSGIDAYSPASAAMLSTDQLTIYLQDHRAGASLGIALARRARGQNEGSDYGDFLTRLADEIEEDCAELDAIMARLGVGKDRLKIAAARSGEQLGRLKLNGRLHGYAPLSRVLELEGLIAGVSVKLALWRSLKEMAPEEPRIDTRQLNRLAERGQKQLTGLRAQQRRAAREAFARS
jgi:hypothetical protein